MMKNNRPGPSVGHRLAARTVALAAAVAFVGVAGLVPVAAGVGAAGSLDLTFDGDGKVVTALAGSDQAAAVATQSDGRIVVVGSSVQPVGTGSDFAVVRYNVDGSLDTTFGGDGAVVTPIGPAASRDEAFAVALQPDGRIVVAGDTWEGSASQVALARYNTDGTLDSTFGGDGTVVVAIGSRSVARGVSIQGAGRIVVAGGATTSSGGAGLWVAVARLTYDGGLDATFAGGGSVITTLGNSSVANAVTIQPDAKIVVVGQTAFFNQRLFAVLRYDANGSADTSFGDGGKVVTEMGTGTSGGADPIDIATAVDLGPDGRILVAGFSSIGSSFQMALVRYRADGSRDPTFGGDGIVTTEVGSLSQAFGVMVDAEGRPLVVGDTHSSGNVDFALVRYGLDGSPDAAFGSGGVITTPIGSDNDHVRGIAMQNDGRIVAAGRTDSGATQNDFAVARYHGDPPLDTTAPETTITVGPPAVTSDATPTFEFSADEAGSIFECSIDEVAFGSCTSPHATILLDDGRHTFAVRATDAAGNTDPTPGTQNFTVDTGPPETVVTSGPDSPTPDTTPTLTFSSSEADSTFACQVDSEGFRPCSSPHETAELASGAHTFTVAATDAADNADPSPATMTFRVCAGPRPDSVPDRVPSRPPSSAAGCSPFS